MAYLAGRYEGRVTAYELWNEPNLQREWNGSPINPADLVRLIGAGAEGVRAADPAVPVAPVGYRSTVAPYTHLRPAAPKGWQEQNQQVAPAPKRAQ